MKTLKQTLTVSALTLVMAVSAFAETHQPTCTEPASPSLPITLIRNS